MGRGFAEEKTLGQKLEGNSRLATPTSIVGMFKGLVSNSSS